MEIQSYLKKADDITKADDVTIPHMTIVTLLSDYLLMSKMESLYCIQIDTDSHKPDGLSRQITVSLGPSVNPWALDGKGVQHTSNER